VPFDDELIYDSDSILKMTRMPKRMIVIGGGVIGCEYAALFAALGVEVSQVATGVQLLPFADREIAERLREYLERLGVRFIFNDRVVTVERNEGAAALTLASGERLAGDIALFAAGRTSNVEGLGLEALGVKLGARGLIEVNDRYQTSVPNIYAAGDVIGFPALASTSMEQARVAMVHAFDLEYKQRVSPVLPLAIYTIPEIAMAGLTEEACREQGIPYLVGRDTYEHNPRGQIIGDMTGMLKLVFSPADKRLLGVHHIGELASELVHIGAHVLAEGGTIDAFIHDVYNYPILADLYKYAAYDGLGALQRSILPNAVPSAEIGSGPTP
jgi:NAD(P) transhydrogenase